jgi:hypothetical protein
MKPLQIGLLVAAGALGGALVMKWQSARHPSMAAVTATAPAMPAPAPAAEAAAADQPAPEPPARAEAPSPFPEKNREPRQRVAAKPRPEPAVIAQVQMHAPAAPAAAPVPPVAPAEPPAPPVRTAPPPQPIQEPAREPSPAPAPAAPNRVTIAAGTLIPIRLVDGLSSDRNLQGDTFSATLDAPLVVGEFAIAERGARVEGKVVNAAKAGKVSGVSKLEIALTGITTSDGQHVRIQTQTFAKNGETSHGEDATKVGAGVGIGAVIGAIAGGGRGAGVGAAVGGAAGAGDVLLTRGKPATLASETRINFRLGAPVTLTEGAR